MRLPSTPFAIVLVLVLSPLLVFGLSEVETKKLNAMRKFKASEPSNLVALSDSNLAKFALNAHRPYHLFIVFNARNPRHQCGPCASFEDEMEVLADSFQMMRDAESADVEDADRLPEVYFARAEFDANQRSFQKYSLRNVPVLAYFPPTGKNQSPQRDAIDSPYVGELDAEGAAVYIRGYTGVNIDIYRSPVSKLITLAVILTILFVMFKYASHQLYALFNFVRGSSTLWLMACIGVYFISISGVLYDIIRGVPAMGADRNGRPTIFHPQSGQQYVFGGLAIGALNLGAGVAVVLLTRYARKAETSGDRTMWATGFSLMFVFLWMQVIGLYRFKSPWYPFSLL